MRRPDRGRLARHSRAIACVDAREEISARLDGEPPMFPDRALEAHLGSCEACRAFQAGIVRIGLGPTLRTVRPPPEGLAGLVALPVAPVAPLDGTADRHGRRRSHRAPAMERVRARSVRWAATLVPLAFVGLAFPIAASARTHVSPTGQPTPCTSHLRHDPAG